MAELALRETSLATPILSGVAELALRETSLATPILSGVAELALLCRVNSATTIV